MHMKERAPLWPWTERKTDGCTCAAELNFSCRVGGVGVGGMWSAHTPAALHTADAPVKGQLTTPLLPFAASLGIQRSIFKSHQVGIYSWRPSHIIRLEEETHLLTPVLRFAGLTFFL